MTTPYILVADLAIEAPIPARGILSQTLSNEKDVEFLLFAFAAGEQLSERTSARPAIIHILEGEGELTVGGDPYPARPGTWLPGSITEERSLSASVTSEPLSVDLLKEIVELTRGLDTRSPATSPLPRWPSRTEA